MNVQTPGRDETFQQNIKKSSRGVALRIRRYGFRTTFIRPFSPLYNRSNHFAPSSSGGVALIKSVTLILPLAIKSMAIGYSPAEAQVPISDNSRVTTAWSGRSTCGFRFPTSVTEPPLRTHSIAVLTVGAM